MAKFGLQDKLALALTSAGSQRELGRRIGVSHQKIGRWLREGNEGGVKKIPSDSTTRASIKKAFTKHLKTTSARAREHNLPLIHGVPVYLERKPLNTGELGDRVFAVHTEFLRPELRGKIVLEAHQTGKFLHVSTRSVIDKHSYAKREAAKEYKKRKGTMMGVYTKPQLAQMIMNAMDRKVAEFQPKVKPILSQVDLMPIFTRYVNIQSWASPQESIREMHEAIREKHEPATGAPGTKLADQLLFQLQAYENQMSLGKQKTKSKRRTKRDG